MDFSAIEKEAEDNTSREISDNIAEDIVEYSRGNVIANEAQYLLTHLQYGTAWMHEMERYVNSVLIGPSAGGKTQVQKNAVPLLPSDLTYSATELTGSAAQDDMDAWNSSLLAPLDEVDKIGDNVREFLKSMAGEDGGYSKKRSVSDDDAESGRSTVTLQNDAMPYQVLYAPEGNKEGIPTELDNRLLKIYVDDNKYIREAIGKKEAGHKNITVHGLDNEYIYDTTELRHAIRSHYRDLDVKVKEYNDDGEPISRRGGSFAKLPEWVWYSASPIFDFSTTSTNRYFGMIFNLMRSSAVLNHHSRRTVTKTVGGDKHSAYLVTPQDVANVLCCQETLLGTTHSLDPQKRAILQAVADLDGLDEMGGCTLRQIKEHLESSDHSVPSKSVLRRILKEELAEGYYIKVREGEGPSNADLYEWRDNGSINPPKLYNLQDAANKDDVTLDGYGVDVSDPFDGVVDPIRDQPFKETVEQFEEELGGESDVSRRTRQSNAADSSMSAAAAMGGGSDSDDDGQQSLTDVSDDDEEDSPSIDTVVERAVYDAVKDNCGVDGKVFKATDHLEDFHIMDLVDEDTEVKKAKVSGTLIDPSNDLWDVDTRDDDWVTTETDAKRELSEAWESLTEKGLIVEDSDVPEGFVGFKVVDVDE